MLCPSQDTQHKVTGSITTPPGWDASPSQDTQHEVTRSITTLPGWDVSPSQDTQHKVVRSITTLPGWDGSPSQAYLQQLVYTPAGRETIWIKVSCKENNKTQRCQNVKGIDWVIVQDYVGMSDGYSVCADKLWSCFGYIQHE